MASMGKKESEKACPECGEMVRPNSVRCWNCGGFMNKDMAVKFQQMQSNPKPLAHLQEESDPAPSAAAQDDDDDFELMVAPTYEIPSPPSGSWGGPGSTESDGDDSYPSPLSAPTEEDPSPLPSLTPGEGGPRVEAPKSEDDALFDLVTKDISESEQRKKKRRPNAMAGGVRTATGGFVIHCPYGCKFEVKESHRGMQGRCPRCKAPFIVPVDPPDYSVSKKPAAAADGAGAVATDVAGGFGDWLTDLHLHTVSPDKLKLKADSLLKEFAEYDVGFSKDQILIVSIAAKKGGGLFGGGGGDKKKEARDAMFQHLKDGKPIPELPGADKRVLSVDQAKEMRVVQPVANRTESLFAGIPIFGTGRIAVQIPFADDPNALPQYLSFSLSEFRSFAKALKTRFGIEDFGAGCGAPLEDAFDEFECHSSKSPFKVLRHLDYYKIDPSFKLVKVGYKCASCHLTMSEAGRAKDNFGGLDGKGIAKAKCPKCQQKFGDVTLLSIDTTPVLPAAPPV